LIINEKLIKIQWKTLNVLNVTMSEIRIFRTETRPRREVSTSREIENETRREIKQFVNVLKSKSKHFYVAGREREAYFFCLTV